MDRRRREGPRCDVGPLGDVGDRGLAVAALGEQLQGGRLDRLPGALLPTLLPINLFCRDRCTLLDKNYYFTSIIAITAPREEPCRPSADHHRRRLPSGPNHVLR
jgi:hypothetical protein